MNNRLTIFPLILIAFLISCSEQNNYIIETNRDIIKLDTINGETESQSREKYAKFRKALLANTINKSIPEIIIFDLSGNKLNLQEILTEKTILISSDSHCGFGQESLTDEFPKALDSLKNELNDYKIICLVKKTSSDSKYPSKLNDFINELLKIYESIYTIDESDAFKINLFGNPVRLYIDKNKDVKHYAVGLSSIENRIKEIKKNTGANNGYMQ